MTDKEAQITTKAPQPPRAKKVESIREHHGRTFIDHYEWLRDKDNPEVQEYLRAENTYTKSKTAHLDALKDTIFEEMKSRIQETDISLPVRSGHWWYISRTQEGKSYARYARIPVSLSSSSAPSPKTETDAQVSSPDKDTDSLLESWTPPTIDPHHPHPDEVTLLDINELAEGHEFFSLGAMDVTSDGRYLAYAVDYAGDERYDLRIKDLETGEDLPDFLPGIAGGVAWAGSDVLFYRRLDEAWRPHQIWRHKRGTDISEDVLVFEEKDEKFWLGIGSTRSEKYMLISSGSKITTEMWYLDLQAEGAEGEFQCILPREEGVEYGVDHACVQGEDRWLIIHNKNGVNSELSWAPVGTLSSLEDTHTLVAHRHDARVDGVDCFKNWLVLGVRELAIERIYLMDIRNGFSEFHLLEFPEEIYSAGTVGNNEWDSPVLRLGYGSYVTPSRVYDLVLDTGERILRKEQAVLGNFQPEHYTAHRRWVEAPDGVSIPVSLIHRVDVDIDSPDSPHPVLLYGYGSYESSMDPYFSVARLSMLDRGVVYAVAHVRGGGEMGREWYDQGKGLKKINTFTDFIAVADDLIAAGITSPERMVAEGGSAGGLLMGAVANMAGDRFVGIEAVVPFVDPLTTITKPELPLTVVEWDEWGDPYHDPEVYDYMARYAPYDNVGEQKYPAILAIAGLNDTRVLYVEPAKWVAKLREFATEDSGEILLKTEMDSGHGGVSGRYDKWKDTAFEIAWELDCMNAKNLLP